MSIDLDLQSSKDRQLRVISLGWGIQSFTLAAMAAVGEIAADVAIHADTTWEKPATYEFSQKWSAWLQDRGLPVVVVGDPDQAQKVITPATDIPAFTLSEKEGQLRRQCTQRWKIEPIRRWLRDELDRRGWKKTPGVVVSIQGISLDEWRRVRDSDVAWILNEYPLISLKMSRADCEGWLRRAGLDVPPKSACVFCPFQSAESWRSLKNDGGDGWQTAVQVDLAIRDQRPPYQLFLHRRRVPLADAVKTEIDAGFSQSSIFADESGCDSGYCFV